MKKRSLIFLFLLIFASIFPILKIIPSVEATSSSISVNPGSEADDGKVNGYSSSSYSVAHSTASLSSSTEFFFGQSTVPGYVVHRGFVKFNTTSIPGNVTITGAKLCLYGKVRQTGSANFTVNLQKWTGDTPINIGDYNSFDNINYDDGAFSTTSWTTSGYNNITIANTALITKEGNTTICVRSSRDVASTTPIGFEYVGSRLYEDGSGYWPLLEVNYTDENVIPAISLSVPSTVYAYQQISLWAVLEGGAGNLVNCTLAMNVSGVTLIWFAVDNSTTKTDLNNFWSLDSSSTAAVNSTAVNVTWTVRLYWNSTKGAYGITGLVYNSLGFSGTASGNFTFVDDLIVAASPTINDTRCNPSQGLLVSGQLYYQGTSTAPYNVTGISAYASLNGVVKASNSSVASSGVFQLSFTAEASSVANYSYNVYSLTDEGSTTNQTVSAIVDRLNITLVANSTNPDAGKYINCNATAAYEYDGNPVTSWSINIYRNSTHYATGNFTDHSDSNILYQYTTENITESTYGLTAFTSNTVTVNWGSLFLEVDTITTLDTRLNINTASISYYHCRWSSNQTNCTTGTISINATAFIINGTGWANVTFTFATTGLKDLSITSVSAEGITSYGQVPSDPQIVWDQADVFYFAVDASRIDNNTNVEVRVRAKLYDAYPFGSGDTVSVNGTGLSWDAGNSWFEGNFSEATVGNWTFEVTSLNETTYIITEYVTSVAVPNCVWDVVVVDSGGIDSTLIHVGASTLVYYALRYEFDDANVTLSSVYLNSTAMTYNSTSYRWEQSVTSLALGNYTYHIASLTDGLYGLTAIDDSVGYENCTFYANVNIRTMDYSGLYNIKNAVVYYNNGSAQVPVLLPGQGAAVVGSLGNWTFQSSDLNGWTFWTGEFNESIQVYVTYYGVTVNGTFTASFTTDTTITINCLCYAYPVNSVTYFCASNATISSASIVSNIFTVSFTGSLDNYVLVSNCPTEPAYIMNITSYDYATAFSSYLVLPHYGNISIKLSYETSWGDLYMKATDRQIFGAAWAGAKLSVTFNGTMGEVGTFSIYCGGRGTPTATSGFVTTSFVGNVLTGSYAFDSTSKTLMFDWTSTGGGSSGTGSGTELSAATLMVDVSFNVTGQVLSGSSVNGTMNVTWTGYMIIYLWNIQVLAPYNNWTALIAGLPLTLTMTGFSGTVQVPVTFRVPSGMKVGKYLVSCMVTFQVPGGSGQRTDTKVLSLQVVSTAQPGNFQMWIPLVLLALLSLAVAPAVFRVSQERKRRKYGS